MVRRHKKYVQNRGGQKHLTWINRTLECTPLLTGG